ncbi:MAG: hypothetical protein ING89_19965 [Rubrivivax sp.]|nr:hypothetical protein [Rubrivivax sp.]
MVLEHYLTDTAEKANHVPPAATQREHLVACITCGHIHMRLNEPAIAPVGQGKPNTQIFRAWAARPRFTDQCFTDTNEQLARQAFKGITLKGLRATGPSCRSPKRCSRKGASPRATARCRWMRPA